MITQNRLKELLNYDSDTGEFTWKVDGTRRHSGETVGVERPGRSTSYLSIDLDGSRHAMHRLAVLMMTGEHPKQGMEVDHIDGDGMNNRWNNLRVVSKSINSRNHVNKTKNYGVHFNKSRNRWISTIYDLEGKKIQLGSFIDKSDAIASRKQAEPMYGYVA